MKQKTTQKKNILMTIVITAVCTLFVLWLAYLMFAPAKNTAIPQTADQTVHLTMKDGNYYPSRIMAKVNQPLTIIADPTMEGCARMLVIPAFKVQKLITPTDNTITITPTKTGTYPFSCSMGMYTGEIVVV